MTIEEKAKAYDEALKRARDMYDAYRFSVDLSNFKPTDFEYIFPVLKESEDEKIRKEAISIVQSYMNICDEEGDPCLSGYKVLTWLENQKEQKPSIFPPGLGEVRWNPISPSSVKQKPVEWSEDDEEMLRIVSNRLDKFSEWATEQGFPIDDPAMKQSPIAWLKSLPGRFNLQPKTGWSGDDNVLLNNIISVIQNKKHINDNTGRKAYVDFLKSLPERFILQPKQKWSKEDERIVSGIYAILEAWDRSHTAPGGIASLVPEYCLWLDNRLKSFRPQPHTVSIENANKFGNLEYERGVKDGIQSEKSRQWKPGEEQMEALESAVKLYKDTHFEIHHKKIVSLYEQLKKLM